MYIIVDKENNNQCVGIGNNLSELRESCARVLAIEQARATREKYEIQFNYVPDDRPFVVLGSMKEVLENGEI